MLLSLLFLVFFSFAGADDPKIDVVVTTPTGTATIRGYDHPYGRSWRGIPYAVTPTGQNRFKNAQRLDPSGLMTALAYGSSCVQGTSGSEDCLFLNVFTKANFSLAVSLPVYVYIHGGGFTQGDGNQGAAIYPNLVGRGPMVMVSINYRLGPFGFFSTRDSMAPGNFAVSDWIEALNWVKRYISFFGGDPSRVTVGGQSSGAEAVSLLSITPQANGLYSQLILESGSAFSAAVFSYSEKTRNTSGQIAVASGCADNGEWGSGSDFGQILNCLRGLTSAQISSVDGKLPDHRMKWGPVQDKVYYPNRLEYMVLNRAPVPVLIGDVHDEWLAWEENAIQNNLNSPSYTQNGLRNTLDSSYEMTYWDNPGSMMSAANTKYIDNQTIAPMDHVGWMAQQIKLYTEMVFVGPVLRDAKYFAYTKSNVYLYSFDYLSPNALTTITQPSLRGVPHSWEMQYIYDNACWGFACDDNDNRLRDYCSRMWTNFVVTGIPTPSGSGLPFNWLKLDSGNRYLSIVPYPVMTVDFHPDSKFWACTAPSMDGYKPPYC